MRLTVFWVTRLLGLVVEYEGMTKVKNTYFFVLGTNHTLSKIDIVNVLVRQGAELEVLAASEELLVIKTGKALAIDPLMAELGSTAKMGELFSTEEDLNGVSKKAKTGEFEEFFWPEGVENPRFGISVYGAGGKIQKLNKIFYEAPRLAREIKDKLGGKVNYLPIRERELSSVVVDQRGLLTKGFELVLGVGEKEIFVGKTLAVQDYEGYSARDYGRPARDAKAGMIPPKLARMMINLANKKKDKLLLDPFCGSGTMLQEMVMLGYRNLIGSDSSEKSTKDSQINLDWLFDKFHLTKKDYEIKLFRQDVQRIASKVNFKTVDAIITEPYLGSPEVRGFHLGQIEREISKLGKLYLAAFEEFKKVLRDDGVVVMIFPVFRFRGQFYHLEILDQVRKLGFAPRPFLIQEVTGADLLELQVTKRGSIIFFRPGQTVSREIFVFSRG